MSKLQTEFLQTIDGLSDETMQILLEIIKQVIVPLDSHKKKENEFMVNEKPRRIGSLKGQKLISDDYDIDECNDEIAKMFGVE